MSNQDKLLNIDDLAEYLGVPAASIRKWRVNGRGPRGRMVGKHLRYRMVDVEAWLDAQPEKVG